MDTAQNGLISGLTTQLGNKLNTSTYNADQSVITASLSSLTSTVAANSLGLSSQDSRLDVLEARTYPQTATQTTYTGIAGISGALNVQAALASLQTNINNVSVASSGFTAPITTLINNMGTTYLGNPLITSIPGVGANNAQARLWYNVSKIDQNMSQDSTNGVSFRKLAIVVGDGNISDLTTLQAFRIIGNSTGNNDSNALTIFKNGSIKSEDKFTIGGPTLEQFGLDRNGLRLKTTATLGSSDGGASINYGSAVNKLNAISQTRLEQLESYFIPKLIFNFPNEPVTTNVIAVVSSEGAWYPFVVSNQGRVRINHSDGNAVIDMNPNQGITMKGYGVGGNANSIVFQINTPADGAAATQMLNNGRLRLWGTTRGNTAIPSIDTTTNGDMSLQGAVSALSFSGQSASIDTFLATSVVSSQAFFTDVQVSGQLIDASGDLVYSFSPTTSPGNREIRMSLSSPLAITNSKDGSVTIVGACNISLNANIGIRPSVIIGDSITSSLMGNSVIIGPSHTLSSLTPSVGVGTVCIGYSNSVLYTQTADNVVIGAGNDVNSFTNTDNQSSRLCIGNYNVCRGRNLNFGNGNDIESTNPNGRGTNVHSYTFGSGWTGVTSSGVNNILVDNTVLLGNGAPGAAAANVVLSTGSAGLPIAEGGSYSQVYIQRNYTTNQARNCLVLAPSSIRYKDNVRTINVDVDDFMKLNCVEFTYKGQEHVNVGLIAEEVNKVNLFNKFVITGEEGIEGLRYESFIAPLINVVQQQIKDMLSFKTLLASQAQEIDELKVQMTAMMQTLQAMMKLE